MTSPRILSLAADPLPIPAMDHRASFGRSPFGVSDGRPDPDR
jgi:hypothetical protein